eukprot:1153435-Pelagomonas_calceolata.AAC.1
MGAASCLQASDGLPPTADYVLHHLWWTGHDELPVTLGLLQGHSHTYTATQVRATRLFTIFAWQGTVRFLVSQGHYGGSCKCMRICADAHTVVLALNTL